MHRPAAALLRITGYVPLVDGILDMLKHTGETAGAHEKLCCDGCVTYALQTQTFKSTLQLQVDLQVNFQIYNSPGISGHGSKGIYDGHACCAAIAAMTLLQVQ